MSEMRSISCLSPFSVDYLVFAYEGAKGSFLTSSAQAASYMEKMQCCVSLQTAEGNFP